MRTDTEIGIALSGGGARGIAHIGVLKALEEFDMVPDKIAGTSMGAIVGVMYAAGFNADEIASVLKTEKIYKWFKVEWFHAGLLSLAGVKEILFKYIGYNEFERLKKPYWVCVSNLNSGKGEIVNKGTGLLDWVIASASVPVLFTPVPINGSSYVDGGLFHNLPAEALVSDCNTIVGSNVMPVNREENVESVKQVGDRVFNLAIAQNTWHSRTYCDFYIESRAIRKFPTWDYSKVDELIDVGYDSACKVIKKFMIPELQG
ncbi:patatin-like phospholipase family protein [Plebeiibacterium marinum]|uniref:Patatin-like phospholipase family protein n=1 Tax=Plebeiibacterium marinum TaxID=2992111 RepID=A0AAE3MDJ3_9BACT|nr:patatin-like phospholipase family protein [Plebeiobacterium marinum]MCW3805559.1 patatin-like phospholipase family protein [Plebeiobacterium marinum]